MNAVAEMGWSAPAKIQADYAGRSEQGPDLSIKLPSREILVAIRELDERGRPGSAFITQTDYLTRTERTTVNKSFTASGKLEVTLTRGWEKHPVLSQRARLEHLRAVPVVGTACLRSASGHLYADLDQEHGGLALRQGTLPSPAGALILAA